jgi:alpha-glucosidase (family GH31 glycosyl hydrolase)
MLKNDDIYVKDPKNNTKDFVGKSWAGDSSWLDFLNVNAQKYWRDQIAFGFQDSTSIYYLWNDMNEPSVFGTESRTLPLDSLHYKVTDANSADGGYHVEHRDIHNLYGALQQRTSYEGLLQRDNFQLRPFVLSRSFFMGS